MKRKLINLMKVVVKNYCEAVAMMYPTGMIPRQSL